VKERFLRENFNGKRSASPQGRNERGHELAGIIGVVTLRENRGRACGEEVWKEGRVFHVDRVQKERERRPGGDRAEKGSQQHVDVRERRWTGKQKARKKGPVCGSLPKTD